MADEKTTPTAEEKAQEEKTAEETEKDTSKEELKKDEKQETQAEKTYTQEEVDKIRSEAAYAARQKAKKESGDISELKAEIQELKKFKEDSSPKLEKLKELEAEKEDQDMRKKIADEVGISLDVVQMLGGNTEEELKANAQKHKEKFGVPVEYRGDNSHGHPEADKSLEKEAKEFFSKVTKN